MRFIEFTKRNIRRTPYQALAASMVMFLTFLSLSIFLLIATGSQKILRHYETKPQVIAFFKDNTDPSDVEAIKKALIDTGKVSNLKYVSKDEALQIYKEKNKDEPVLLELVTASILPASLEISTHDPMSLKPIAEILQKEPVIDQVLYPGDVIDFLARATTVVRWTGGVAVSFLIIFSILVILMIIGFKIRLRRNEIEIMRLHGASNWFIRAPFLAEGIFYAILGALCAWVVSYIALWYLTPFLQDLIGEIKLLPVSPLVMLALLGAQLLTAIIIGGLGSYGAVRRYLKL